MSMQVSKRHHGPVTTRGIDVPETEPLVSRTDLRGMITFVNPVFAEVSGYPEAELIGSPHCLVRHPDMPAAAFKDLWRTIQAGRPWHGLVKNRAKNGDFYWVSATVSPEIRDGKTVGYISIRSRPSAEERDRAEHVYAAMRADRAKGISLVDGVIVQRHTFSWLSDARRSITSWVLAGNLLTLMLMAGMGWTGFSALTVLNEPRAASRLLLGTGALLALGAGLTTLIGWQARKLLTRSIRQVEEECRSIASGHFTGGHSAPAAREFRGVSAMLQAVRAHLSFSAWEQLAVQRRSETVRHETISQMADTIDQEAGGAVNRVAESSSAMAGEAETMADSAGRVGADVEQVTGAVAQALASAQSVAGSSEGLAHSIRTIAAQVVRASEMASTGAHRGEHARQTIGSLSEVAERIGTVVALISDIAARTNLLALNATIEASRAGEAGRGFAVVAGEVKTLASQTARATEDVARQIAALRQATDSSVHIVTEIGGTLETLASASLEVAQAIERQSSSTDEIARNVAASSAAVQTVTGLITGVATEAVEVGRLAGGVRSTARKLAGDVEALRQALTRTVRTATAAATTDGEERLPIDAPCEVEMDGQTSRARLSSLSRSSAEILLPNRDVAYGAHGRLTLNGDAAIATGFIVRSVEASGRLHVQLTSGTATPAFPRAIEMLLFSAKARHAAA